MSSDLNTFMGMRYSYILSSKWSIHSTLSSGQLGGISFGFEYDNPHIYINSSGAIVDNGLDAYGTGIQGYAVLLDIGSSFSIINSNRISLKLGVSIGAIINDINRSGEMIHRYIMPDGSLGEVYYGQYDICQANSLSPYGALDLTGEINVTDQFFISGGLNYRTVLGPLTDDAYVELVDGIGQVSDFRFSAGFNQFGIRAGVGYRF